ncbi:MAG: hypothetical protein A2087_04930 [Spirochaetes bacterium GWD1_61_31]|nr:MAG: hypothetical protein A2Y37_01530 [Spirochaetes bacterium GWB1_60_80]OHD34896.1 MAG: hypothetical protein A2004_00560 [Spirochaetes bacterium GWC1_61_12]OHD37075.1 MAG: hypothetical protein A2087_04930 [Spirochaetes bacterium GWD1_61_31]OHD44660.1 MAG: hypothetical protein A2Y35_11870 [Spirochaetes bacterium GWE1_60_18]OHD61067.1 MAG: hypothetical protein A2Y32_09145 [Spirochaetes bacterium GWF1_60_12]HAP42727.1 hypothetical protein [Spirochaetaceae bacterium]
MTRQNYLDELARELAFLPADEAQDVLLEFASHIDDAVARKPELGEAEILQSLPHPSVIAAEYRSETGAGQAGQAGRLPGDTCGSDQEKPSDGSAERSGNQRYHDDGPRGFRLFKQFFRYTDGEEQEIEEEFAGIQRLEISGVSADINLSPGAACACRINGYWDEDSAPRLEVSGGRLCIQLGPNADEAEFSLPPELVELVIKTTSGDVEGEVNEGAAVRVQSTSGDVNLTIAAGLVDISTASGDIDLEGVIGDATIRTASGDVSLVGLQAGLKAVTASGGIDAAFEVVTADAVISTASGDISVNLPSDDRPSLVAVTVSGDISVPDGRVRSRPGRSSCEISGGDVELRINTLSGDIDIEYDD